MLDAAWRAPPPPLQLRTWCVGSVTYDSPPAQAEKKGTAHPQRPPAYQHRQGHTVHPPRDPSRSRDDRDRRRVWCSGGGGVGRMARLFSRLKAIDFFKKIPRFVWRVGWTGAWVRSGELLLAEGGAAASSCSTSVGAVCCCCCVGTQPRALQVIGA